MAKINAVIKKVEFQDNSSIQTDNDRSKLIKQPMHTFKPTRSYLLSDLLSSTLGSVIFMIVVLAIVYCLFPNRVTVFVLIAPVFVLLKQLYHNATVQRLVQLTIDDGKRGVQIKTRSFTSKARKIALSFEDLCIEVTDERTKSGITVIESIVFLQGKTEVFEITTSKDHLSSEDMQEIPAIAERHTIAVVK